jgi:DNA-binding IclR family transcriptional regulator
MNNEVPSAEKILDLIEVFLQSTFTPLSVAEIMDRSKLKRNTADRLLNVLEQRNFVARTGNKKWIWGSRLVRFSMLSK